MYDRTSHLSSVNEARKEIFCQKNQSVDKIPPTQDALLQHTHQALYQAGIWTTCTQAQPTIPSPEQFGWTKESGHWVPITIPEVSRACSELIKCSCKGTCTRCKCVKANLSCSPPCACKCNANPDLDSYSLLSLCYLKIKLNKLHTLFNTMNIVTPDNGGHIEIVQSF